MKRGVPIILSMMFVGLASSANAAPDPRISCSSVSLGSPPIPNEAQIIARKMEGRVSQVCNNKASGELIYFDVRTPAAYDPVGVCAYQIHHFRKVKLAGTTEWSAIDAGGRRNSSTYMRLSETCDGNDGFVRLINVSTGSFIRISNQWNKLFSPERMERFLGKFGAQQDESLRPLIISLRAHARSGLPIGLQFIGLEAPSDRPFPYFRIGFQDTSTFLMIDLDGEELSLLGSGFQS
jgi:hypothetical protein